MDPKIAVVSVHEVRTWRWSWPMMTMYRSHLWTIGAMLAPVGITLYVGPVMWCLAWAEMPEDERDARDH